MSSDRTKEDVWYDQNRARRAANLEEPRELDQETETILRKILGDDDVDAIKATMTQRG